MSLKGVIIAGLAALWLALAGTPAWAQLGGVVGQVPRLPGVGRVGDLPVVSDVDRFGRQVVDEALQAPRRATGLIRQSDGALEADPFGWPVVRGEIVAIDLSDAAKAQAIDVGYRLLREERIEALDLTTTVFAPPRRLSLARAVKRLQEMDPDAEVEFNHVYSPAGEVADRPAPGGMTALEPAGPPGGLRLGLIDTGVEASHPAFAGVRLTQRGFAGAERPGAHGTAVASLMVGRSGAFSGASPGAALWVADIYGGQAAGGSSTGLAQALAWMVEQEAQVVNISLVGPRNALVQRAVERAQARGLTLVAAVGNDGPAAAPLYPASYEGVIGVTGVSGNDRVLPEAGRGPQVDLAAPGSDMAAAGVAGGYVSVRGTSFASPIVAALIAREGGVREVARGARDLGERGPDYVYGAGLVGGAARVAPASVGARGRLAR